MSTKYTNLSKEEVDKINSFIERYENVMENRGYSFSDIKERSSRKRELIFQDLEQETEIHGSYNLEKVLEHHASTKLNQDEDEIVVSIPVPEVISLFKMNLSNPFKGRKFKMPKRIRRQAPRYKERAEKIDNHDENNEPLEEQSVVTEAPMPIRRDLSVIIDYEAITNFVERRMRGTKKFTKVLHWIIFSITLIFYVAALAVQILTVFYPYSLYCYSSNYDLICVWTDYKIRLPLFMDVFYFVVPFVYLSALSLVILIYMVSYFDKLYLRNKIGKFIIMTETYELQDAIDYLGYLSNEFSYRGYIKFRE